MLLLGNVIGLSITTPVLDGSSHGSVDCSTLPVSTSGSLPLHTQSVVLTLAEPDWYYNYTYLKAGQTVYTHVTFACMNKVYCLVYAAFLQTSLPHQFNTSISVDSGAPGPM